MTSIDQSNANQSLKSQIIEMKTGKSRNIELKPKGKGFFKHMKTTFDIYKSNLSQ